MHVGLVAVKAAVSQLRDAVLLTWPELEVVASDDELPDADTMWAWKEAHEEFVSAANWSESNRGKTVYVFWQDGSWAILLDFTYLLATDEEKLAILSSRLGTVVSLVVETTGGTAYFACFENRQLRRKIEYTDGNVTLEGEPLSEEATIDVAKFYVDEAEAIWKAFGLSPPYVDSCSHGFQAISVIDHTDYKDLVGPRAEQSAQHVQNRPWWRLW